MKKKVTKKEAFKYWGTLNGFSDEKYQEFRKAQLLHMEDRDKNPDAHQYAPTDYQQTSRGYTENRCKCGFGYYVDSSG
jgi:hypothetical protein